MTSSSQARFSKSNGSVFEDLRLPNAAAAVVTSSLAALVARHLRRRALAVADATKLLGLSRKHASALARGRLDGFTAERLMVLLTGLGLDIDIIVHDSPAPAGYTGRIDVRGSAPRR